MKRMPLIFLIVFGFAQTAIAAGPISTWSKDELAKMPEGFMATLKVREKQWHSYIDNQEELYSSQYGSDVKNIYDLFQKELSQPSPAANGAPVIQAKTARRLADLVWVSGKSLPRLQNTNIYNLKLLSYRNGAIHIIPCDVLEFTQTGRIILPNGPEANLKDSDGVLGENDKIFFMAADLGHKVSLEYVKNAYKNIKEVSEIEISYSPDNEKGWVYLASFAGDAPKCGMDYVNMWPDSSTVATPFVLAQERPRKTKKGYSPTVDICTWAMAPSIGGTEQDIYNKFYINTKMAFRMGVNITEDQEDFNLSWRAWFDGSVIGFKRVSWKLSTPLGIGAPTIFTDVMISAFSVYDENFLATPFDPSIMLKNFTLCIGEDLNSEALTENVYIVTPDNRKGYKVNGAMKSMQVIEEKKPGLRDLWHVVASPVGSICMYGGVNDFIAEKGKLRLEYFDMKESLARRTYVIEENDFKNRQEDMYIEWTAVPFFYNGGNYNWKNLELVQKHRSKPLSVSVDGGPKTLLGRFTHRPDIAKEKKFYKY